jgi:hypothetical protein
MATKTGDVKLSVATGSERLAVSLKSAIMKMKRKN